MALDNKWVRYFDKTYQQIKDRVMTGLGSLTPEITDHSESNPYVKMLGIWSGIAEMLGYYIDNAGREAHLSTARLYWSGVKIARAYDYRIKASIPATGSIKLTLNQAAISDITIQAGSIFSTDEGLEFISTEVATVLAGESECIVEVRQMVAASTYVLGVTDGSTNQSLVLPDNVADNTVMVTINGDNYLLQETLAFSISTDKHCKQDISVQGVPIVVLGDGLNGELPIAGQDINVTYYSTSGSAGNVATGLVTSVETLVLPAGYEAEVTNETAMVGGADIESLDSMKLRIPKQVRTNDRAITPQDYIDVAELKTGVAKAGVEYTCGGTVDVYIVPEGGGIASSILLSDTQEWMDLRRSILTKVLVKTAGEVHIALGINLKVLPSYQRLTVVADVRAELEEFLSYLNQTISGTVYLSDLYETIENVDGVSSSAITSMKPIPYGKPVGGTTDALDWNPRLSGSSTVTTNWKLRIISPVTFDLSRENIYVGTYAIGDTVNEPEISFEVNGSYPVNSQWTFVTYPSFGTLELSEPSIPVSSGTDIVINATGGL